MSVVGSTPSSRSGSIRESDHHNRDENGANSSNASVVSASAAAMSARVEAERQAAQLRFMATLQVVHKATVLFYVREKKSAEIAKIIKPELSKLIKASEQREAISLIERYNNTPNQQGINLVIADVDNMIGKLLDALKRRKQDEATKSYPLLPLILLVSPHSDPELVSNIMAVGGYDFILTPPFTAKDVFESAVAALSRMESVQKIYADIHKYKEAQKFPYLPIFEHVNQSMVPSEAHDFSDDNSSHMGLSQISEIASTQRGQEEQDDEDSDDDEGDDTFDGDEDDGDMFNIDLRSKSGEDTKTTDVDATAGYDEPVEKQSILPDFVISLRKETSINKLKSGDRAMDSRELAYVDSIILKSMSHDKDHRRKTMRQGGRQNNRVMSIQSGNRLQADIGIDRKGSRRNSIASMKRTIARAAADAAHKNPIRDFERPKWKVTVEGSMAGNDLNPELLPFIAHNPPPVTHRSVAGLSRKEVKTCWKTIKSKIGTTSHRLTMITPNTASFLHDGLDIDSADAIRSATGGSLELRSAPHTSSSNAAGALSDKLDSQDGTGNQTHRKRGSDAQRSTGSSNGRNSPTSARHARGALDHLASDSIESGRNSPVNNGKKERGGGAGVSDVPVREKRHAHAGERLSPGIFPSIKASSSPVHKGALKSALSPDADETKHPKKVHSGRESLHTEGSSELERTLFSSHHSDDSEAFGYIIQMRAKKHVAMLASKAPEDPDTGKIMFLKFTDRNLNFDVRDHLEEGFTHQVNGNYAEAEELYDKAVSTGKSVSLALPLAMRGIVRFLQRNYMKAMKDFTDSIALYEQYGETKHDKADTAAVLYNRALSHFRIGDDDSGISDLRKALDEYDSDNFQIRQMLILAYRRVDKFDQATEQCVILKEKRDAQVSATLRDGILLTRSYDSEYPANTRASVELDRSGGGDTRRMMSNQSQSVPKHRLTALSKSFAGLSGSRTSRVVPTYHVPIATTDFSATKTAKHHIGDDRSQGDENASIVSGALSLEHEKIVQGFTRNVFDTLFVNTTALQEVLSQPNKSRSKAGVAMIEAKLKEVPFLREVDRADLRKLAACVEYRTISDRGPLFSQDRPMDMLCVLLSGQWQLRVEIVQHVVPIWTLNELDVYGAMDLLFRNPHSAFVQKYQRMEVEDAKRAGTASKPGTTEATVLPKQESYGSHQHKEIVTARALLPGAFMSCTVLAPAEVILIPANDFDAYLSRIAERDFERRLELLSASGLFKGDLKRIDLIRMARMSQIQCVSAGTTILNQGEVPSRLYFVLKGICNVQKRPDKSERTVARILEVKELIKDHDMKYSFHHKLRKNLAPAPEEFARTTDHNFSTAAEHSRHELEKELAELEEIYAREKSQPSEQFVADVTKLKWPMMFGEAAVSLPEGRGSLGTITADTYCEILSVHKTHLQTFHLMDDFQERLRIRCVKYPPDDVLLQRRESAAEWSAYRADVLEDISKKRWPGLIEIAEKEHPPIKM